MKCHRSCQSGLANQSYFLAIILSTQVLKIWQLKNKIGEILAFLKKFSKFLKLEVALI